MQSHSSSSTSAPRNKWGSKKCLLVTTILLFALAIPSLIYLLRSLPKEDMDDMLGLPYSAQLRAEFLRFQKRYDKHADGEMERLKRLRIFAKNFRFVQTHNQLHPDIVLEVNELADLTEEEVAGTYLIGPQSQFVPNPSANLDPNPSPEVDWRRSEVFPGTMVALERTAAVAAYLLTEAVSAYHSILAKTAMGYSPDVLRRCTASKGVSLSDCVEFVKVHGISRRGDEVGDCADFKGEFFAKAVGVPSGDNDKLLSALNAQPVIVGLNGSNKVFRFYKRGIIREECGEQTDHYGLLVGAGTEQGVPYWVVKNVWGSSWGEGGYVRIKRDVGIAPGVCGIALGAVYLEEIKSASK